MAKMLGMVLSLGILMSACTSEVTGPPVDDSVLVNVLTELHLADSRMLLDEHAPDSLRAFILAKYQINETLLHESITYLSDHPDELALLYTRVVDKIVASTEASE